MERFRQPNNSANANSAWDELAKLNTYEHNGILLVGNAAHEQRMKDLGLDKDTSQPSSIDNNEEVLQSENVNTNENTSQPETLGSNNLPEQPEGSRESFSIQPDAEIDNSIMDQSEELDYSEPVATQEEGYTESIEEPIKNPLENANSEDGNETVEKPQENAQEENNDEPTEELLDDAQTDTQPSGNVDAESSEKQPDSVDNEMTTEQLTNEEQSDYKEIAFTQSTDLADELKRNPDYITYLVSSDQGFAVEKAKAVSVCIEKMENAKNNDEIWQAIRLSQDITNHPESFSEEEIQKVREFMTTPVARKNELIYRIANEEKSLKRTEEAIRRSEKAYEELNSANIVEKFLKRGELRMASDRLEASRRRKKASLETIKRQRAELQRVEASLGEAA